MKRGFLASCLITAIITATVINESRSASIQVVGLFSGGGGAAVILVDGVRHLVKNGKDSPAGIRLIRVNAESAVLEVNGQRETYFLSRANTQGYARSVPDEKKKQKVAAEEEIRIQKNGDGHFTVEGTINQKPVLFLVDTGASTIGMSSKTAGQLGIKYQTGEKVQVSTAAGRNSAYRITLDAVSIGSLTIKDVSAVVSEGENPYITLLGMSFLQHTDMRYKDDVLFLKKSN